MKYELIKLPYEANALEPVISKETLGFHHGKHLNAYVNNLNAAIEGTKYEEMPLEEIAMKLDISRERTRQIRDRALKRLKSEPNSPLLQMYMNQ